MTREEIIQRGKKKFPPVIIKEIRDDGTIARTDMNATIRLAYIQGLLDNNCLLPSDLEEAADAYIRRVADAGWEWTTQDIAEAFKAGAEWMAGQYEKIEGELVDWYSTSDGKDYCCGVRTMDAFEVPEGFYIRKK